MADSRTGRRGSYAKGVVKREEILTRAPDVIDAIDPHLAEGTEG